MSDARIHFQAMPTSNLPEVSSKARALVTEIAAGMRLENDLNIPATLAASAVVHSVFCVLKMFPMSADDVRAACDVAVSTLIAQGFVDNPRPDGQA